MSSGGLGGVATALEKLDGEAMAMLNERFGDRFATSQSVREQHCGLEGHHPMFAPDAVIYASTVEEVSWC